MLTQGFWVWSRAGQAVQERLPCVPFFNTLLKHNIVWPRLASPISTMNRNTLVGVFVPVLFWQCQTLYHFHTSNLTVKVCRVGLINFWIRAVWVTLLGEKEKVHMSAKSRRKDYGKNHSTISWPFQSSLLLQRKALKQFLYLQF